MLPGRPTANAGPGSIAGPPLGPCDRTARPACGRPPPGLRQTVAVVVAAIAGVGSGTGMPSQPPSRDSGMEPGRWGRDRGPGAGVRSGWRAAQRHRRRQACGRQACGRQACGRGAWQWLWFWSESDFPLLDKFSLSVQPGDADGRRAPWGGRHRAFCVAGGMGVALDDWNTYRQLWSAG
jgi:hypothetical protein